MIAGTMRPAAQASAPPRGSLGGRVTGAGMVRS
jgi:hypothetical protein